MWQEAFTSFGNKKNGIQKRSKPAVLPANKKIYSKPLEQVHMLLGTYGLCMVDEARFTYMLLNVLLGGNMSSRLFQEVREKRGLAYSIYSYIASYSDCGYLAIYMGVDRDSVNESITLIDREINKLQDMLIPETELCNAKDFVKSGLFLSMENMEVIMTRIARNEMYFGRYIPLEEVVESIDLVERQDIKKLAGDIFGGHELTVVGLGPMEKAEIDWNL